MTLPVWIPLRGPCRWNIGDQRQSSNRPESSNGPVPSQPSVAQGLDAFLQTPSLGGLRVRGRETECGGAEILEAAVR